MTKLSHSEIVNHIDNMAKPKGSLGRLEAVAAKLCVIQNTLNPQTRPRKITLFAGDHGVVQSGVTPWPSELTTLMMRTILGGGAASAVLANANSVDLALIDTGSINPLSEQEYKIAQNSRIAAGTKNLAHEPAMSIAEFDAAWAIGAAAAQKDVAGGYKVLLCGEMGIGNTTPAAALTALICGFDAAIVTGKGAGADDAMLGHKIALINNALRREIPQFSANPKGAIAALCGFEIAAMAGYYNMAAQLGAVVLLDGFIATAAALIAAKLSPDCRNNFIAAHQSEEKGHKVALEYLGLQPILEWDMRLGEGTGALIALSQLDNAAALMNMWQLKDVLGQ